MDNQRKRTGPIHRCEVPADMAPGTRGHAVTEVYECALGRFWAHNGEYVTQVKYCPFCGQAAQNQT